MGKRKVMIRPYTSGVETGVFFLANYIRTMVTDAIDVCVASSSAKLILVMQGERVSVIQSSD